MAADIIKLFEMVLLLGAGALSSCSKGDDGGAVPGGNGGGRPCIFSAVTEGTKTSYSGFTTDGRERINWVEGDTVRIYSPQAYLHGNTGSHFSDYVIKSVAESSSTSTTSSGTLASLSGNGLVWAGGSSDHYFYSVYPSPSANSKVSIAGSGSGNGVKISATIPAAQTASEWTWSGAEYTSTLTGSPDMRYAYMVASSMVNPSAASITMQYNPWFTAFQIEIGTGAFGDNDGGVTIDSFTLSTSGSDDALAGKFTLTGTAGGTISAAKDSSAGSRITVPVGKTIKGTAGKLVLTVFTLPIKHSQITLTFTGPEIGTRSLDLRRSGTWLNFDPCKKIKITGLSLPENKFDTGGEDISWGAPPFGGPFILGGTTYYLSNGDLYLKTPGADFASSTFGLYEDPFYSVMNNFGVPSKPATNNTTVNRSYFNWLELGSLFSTAAVSTSSSTNIDNTTVPTGIASGCKVPTRAQWQALTTIAGRPGSTVTISGTEHSSCRYAKVAVSGKQFGNAMVLFPDGVVINIGSAITCNSAGSDFQTITLVEYDTLLAAGCVFLPAAGRYDSGWSGRGSYGYYWSSTAYYSSYAYNLYFYSSNVYPDTNSSREYGFFPVRLLQES